MNNVLTKAQINHYNEFGFVAPIDVMSEQQALDLAKQLELIEREYPEHINAENRNNAHLSLKFLDEVVHNDVIVGAVSDLIGPDVSLWGSVLFIKDPQTKGFVSWHQDATYMGIEPKDFVTPWLALSHSNLQNGCMTMIPGSHKQDIQQHEDTFSKNNLLTRGQVVKGVDDSNAVNLILKPGQMSMHHARTIHGSRPNKSNERRVGYAIQAYMPPTSRQVIGENYWLDIRGNFNRKDEINLSRPKSNLDADGIKQREMVNQNWANILYEGAEKTRAY